MEDYRIHEQQITKLLLYKVDYLSFELSHTIQLVIGEDYQYQCLIDGQCFATGLTPMFTYLYGIERYIKKI